VHLTPRERERLLLAAAADLARRRLARGAPLGSTEAVALVCDEVCELAWDGIALAEVIDRARRVVPPAALLPGVAGLVPVIEVEALFPWGSTLVHVDAPFGPPGEAGPVRPAAGTIELAPGAERRTAQLRNTGTRDVWISSHYPLDQVNPAERVLVGGEAEPALVRDDPGDAGSDGEAAAGPPPGCRLDLPAGEALLLKAGEEREVRIVVR
jgi:urease subunit gamma/beta